MEFRVLRFISVLVVTFLFISCSKEVKIDIPGYEKQHVIDANIEIGQPPIVFISTSNDIYSPTNLSAYLNGFIDNALVYFRKGKDSIQLTKICSDELPVGSEDVLAPLFGVSKEELTKLHLCLYSTANPAFFGEVGETYQLSVRVDGNYYRAETELLPPVKLDKVYWKEDPDALKHGFSWAKMTDPLNEYNAYYWSVKRIKTLSDGTNIDANFKSTFSPAFDDKFFDGQTFDYAFENPFSFTDTTIQDEFRGYYAFGDTVVIKFSRTNKAAFQFLERKHLQLQTAGNPFASPTSIPSSFTGGALGSFIGFSSTYDTLICKP